MSIFCVLQSGRACEEAFSKHPQFLEMSRQASFLTLSDPKYCGKMQVNMITFIYNVLYM